MTSPTSAQGSLSFVEVRLLGVVVAIEKGDITSGARVTIRGKRTHGDVFNVILEVPYGTDAPIGIAARASGELTPEGSVDCRPPVGAFVPVGRIRIEPPSVQPAQANAPSHSAPSQPGTRAPASGRNLPPPPPVRSGGVLAKPPKAPASGAHHNNEQIRPSLPTSNASAPTADRGGALAQTVAPDARNGARGAPEGSSAPSAHHRQAPGFRPTPDAIDSAIPY